MREGRQNTQTYRLDCAVWHVNHMCGRGAHHTLLLYVAVPMNQAGVCLILCAAGSILVVCPCNDPRCFRSGHGSSIDNCQRLLETIIQNIRPRRCGCNGMSSFLLMVNPVNCNGLLPRWKSSMHKLKVLKHQIVTTRSETLRL